MYDDVLKIPMSSGTTAFGFADDLTLVVTGKHKENIMTKGNKAIRDVDTWMKGRGLQLVPEKTEAHAFHGTGTKNRDE